MDTTSAESFLDKPADLADNRLADLSAFTARAAPGARRRIPSSKNCRIRESDTMSNPPENTDAKQGGRGFRKGQSGNPAGRPKGSRNRATLVLQALFEGEADAIGRKAIEKAKSGDMFAQKLIMDRLFPVPKDRLVNVKLPAIAGLADVPKAFLALTSSAAAGEISPAEAAAMQGLLDGYRRALDTAELEERVRALESRIGP